MSSLPPGWAILPAGELGTWRGGGTPSKGNERYWTDGTIPWVSPKDMKRQFITDTEDHITQDAIAESATQEIPANSIMIVTRSGILQHSLPVAINTIPMAINQDIKALTPFEGIHPEYILRHLQADADLILQVASKTGTTVDSVDFDRLKAYPVRVAPFAEQKRIASKVSELMARTGRAADDLKRIQPLIAKYKERLLALAFSGNLLPKNGSDKKVKFSRVDEIATISSGYGFPKEMQGKARGDYPFAKVSDISRSVAERGGRLQVAANYVDEADLKALRIKPVAAGSVVFAKIGEALKLNRRALATVPLVVDNNCMALSPDISKVLPEYLFLFMRTVDLGPLSVATAIPSVRRGDVAELQILLPSLETQAEIVSRIEAAFKWLDRIATEHAAARKLLPKLDRAILSKAFRGELVPQSPSDEPADTLIARMRAQGERTPRKVRSKATKDKPMTRDPKSSLLKDSENWPENGLAFHEIAKRNAITYDDMRNVIFELLSGPNPKFQQVFDKKAECMVLRRVRA